MCVCARTHTFIYIHVCIYVYKLLAKDQIFFIVDLAAIINQLPINYWLGHVIWLTLSLMIYFHIHLGVQLYILWNSSKNKKIKNHLIYIEFGFYIFCVIKMYYWLIFLLNYCIIYWLNSKTHLIDIKFDVYDKYWKNIWFKNLI